MKINKVLCCASSVFLLLSQQALARDYYPSGLYILGGGVYSSKSMEDLKVIPSPEPVVPITVVEPKADSADPGINIGLGYSARSFPIAVELVYTWRQDLDYNKNPLYTTVTPPPPLFDTNFQGTANFSSFMLNLSYTLHFQEYVSPYVKVGIGPSLNKAEATVKVDDQRFNISQTKYNFAWQIGVGARFRFTNNLFLDAEYHYLNLGKIKWPSWTTEWEGYTHKTSLESDKVNANEFALNLVYYFDEQYSDQAIKEPTLIRD